MIQRGLNLINKKILDVQKLTIPYNLVVVNDKSFLNKLNLTTNIINYQTMFEDTVKNRKFNMQRLYRKKLNLADTYITKVLNSKITY